MRLEEFLLRLEGVKKMKDGYIARCPAHEDRNPSLSITERDGKILLHCFAGCTPDEIVSALGLEMKDLFTDGEEGKAMRQTDDKGLTLEEYSEAKKLPLEFLRSLGVREMQDGDGKSYLAIPYPPDPDARERGIAWRYRFSLEGDNRFGWQRGTKPRLYGTWRKENKESENIILVEGESDAQTLWYVGVPALGVPGVNCWRDSWGRYLKGKRVYVWEEPDVGDELTKKLANAPAKEIFTITPPDGIKDVSDLWLACDGDKEKFLQELKALIRKARGGSEEETLPFLREIRDIEIPEMERPLVLQGYEDYCKAFSPDLPQAFSDTTSILWLGIGLGHKCRLIDIPGKDTSYPLLWLLLISPPASLKSTAINLLRDALPPTTTDTKEGEELPTTIIPDLSSVEGVFNQLAQYQETSLLLIQEEFVSLLSNARKNSYLSQWRNFLLSAYHPRLSRPRSLAKKTFEISDITLFVATSITPENLLRWGGEEELQSGFLTRFMPVFLPEGIERGNGEPNTLLGENTQTFLIETQRRYWELPFRNFRFTPSARELYQKLNQKFQATIPQHPELAQNWLARGWESVPRIALLLSACEIAEDEARWKREKILPVEERHLLLALDIFKKYIYPSIVKVSQFLLAGDRVYRETMRVANYLKQKEDHKATRSEIMYKLHLSAELTEKVKYTGYQMGLWIFSNERTTSKKMEIWRLISSSI